MNLLNRITLLYWIKMIILMLYQNILNANNKKTFLLMGLISISCSG